MHDQNSKEQQSHGLAKNRYPAGLWESDLVDHVLWIPKPINYAPWLGSYHAPTWSWASINGPGEFLEQDRKGSIVRTIAVLPASLSTSPHNPFGTSEASPANCLHLRDFSKQYAKFRFHHKRQVYLPRNIFPFGDWEELGDYV